MSRIAIVCCKLCPHHPLTSTSNVTMNKSSGMKGTERVAPMRKMRNSSTGFVVYLTTPSLTQTALANNGSEWMWEESVVIWFRLHPIIRLKERKHRMPRCPGRDSNRVFSEYNSMVWVRERTIPTERPPLVGEVIANFCVRIEGATWSAWRIPTAVFSVF
jgi:hypothetical protein